MLTDGRTVEYVSAQADLRMPEDFSDHLRVNACASSNVAHVCRRS